ncbi:MAG: substrate-binding domain-containing protein [Verrucomicrobiaceae bacterium]|nr:substrate-binding domain-containing protein [Verrucomicrobiaceae bacterium]
MNAVPPRPSLVTHSADFLRETIQRGEWKDHLPSERTLCTRMRISRPTLRAVLSQLEREGILSPVTHKRRHILSAAKATAGRARSRTIVLLTPVPAQLMPPFVLFWLDALRELLADADYLLEVHASPSCFTGKPAGSLKKLMQRVTPAAWVLFRSTAAMQRWFSEHQLPAVLAGTCAEGIALPSVDIDYRATCRHAASLLVKKGHRRITLLLPDSTHGGDAESELGYREGLSVSGTTPAIVRHRESAADLVRCLDEALRGPMKPTAFLVARSMHALTVVSHLLRQGHRLPRDLAVVSRDDDAFLDHLVPKVTRYAANPARFARQLSKLVLEVAQTGRARPKPMRLMPDLVRGETV